MTQARDNLTIAVDTIEHALRDAVEDIKGQAQELVDAASRKAGGDNSAAADLQAISRRFLATTDQLGEAIAPHVVGLTDAALAVGDEPKVTSAFGAAGIGADAGPQPRPGPGSSAETGGAATANTKQQAKATDHAPAHETAKKSAHSSSAGRPAF